MQIVNQNLGRYRKGVGVSAVAFVAVLSALSWPPQFDAALIGLLALAYVFERQPLRLPRYGPLSLADSVHYGVALLYGPLATILSTVLAGGSRFSRESSDRRLKGQFVFYSMAQNALSYGAGACLMTAVWPSHWAGKVAVTALSVTLTFVIQSVLVALHQWLEQRTVGSWKSRINWERLRLSLQATAPLGALMALSLTAGFLPFVLLLGPLVVTYLSIKNYTDTLREAREVIESLVEAVERREPQMAGHAARVASYAADIARVLGLEEGLVARVATAGRLHDLGKISVSEEVLHKSGSLDSKELEMVRRHPEIGAQVASKLSLSRQEAEFIRYHHEWYNGAGYPYGIQGEAIPLGARILAVAEAFDTMLSPTVYGEAVSQQEALEDLKRGEGTQFDPRVVAALTTALQKRGVAVSA